MTLFDQELLVRQLDQLTVTGHEYLNEIVGAADLLQSDLNSDDDTALSTEEKDRLFAVILDTSRRYDAMLQRMAGERSVSAANMP